jgi:hypothetical protein
MNEDNKKYCYFCKQFIGNHSIIYCFRHHSNVMHYYDLDSNKCYNVRFTIEIKDKIFRVVLYPISLRTEVFIQMIERRNYTDPIRQISGDYNVTIEKQLINIDTLLNITPENAIQKLPTILTFS